MRTGDVSDLPNPFAPDPPAEFSSTESLGTTRHAVIASLKLLVLLVIGFVAFSFITQRGPDWLASRLTSDFQSQDTTTKQARLKQLSELGNPGINGLVLGLADGDPLVAQESRQFIRDLQTSWTSMPTVNANRSRKLLSQSLQAIDANLSDERQAWVRELIQNTQRDVPLVVTNDSETPLKQPVAQAGYQSIEPPNASSESLMSVPRPRARVIQVRFNEEALDENRVMQPSNDLQPFPREQPLLLRSVRDL